MDFSKLDGLIPAVIQDDRSGEVLMVGFMNDEALRKTRETGFATFFSRTRGKLWTKGETSGNRLEVKRMLVDCDDDTVLIKVTRSATGHVPHRRATCFYRELARDASLPTPTPNCQRESCDIGGERPCISSVSRPWDWELADDDDY